MNLWKYEVPERFKYPLSSVMSLHDGSFTVLLGFSYDGFYCLFYSCRDTTGRVELFWKKFPPPQVNAKENHHEVIQPVGLFPHLRCSERQEDIALAVAQSRDLRIVAAIGVHSAASKAYHITITTSPIAGT